MLPKIKQTRNNVLQFSVEHSRMPIAKQLDINIMPINY